jgi:type I site-specific restriction endonuclease
MELNMCEKTSIASVMANFHTSASSLKLPKFGSKRKRLWEISRDAFCPIIGVCLSINALRKLVHKISPELAKLEDYDLHVNVIAQCGHRNRLSEALQSEFEQRFSLVIKRFREAKDADRLMHLWKSATQQGEVAGAFWASISHPCCDLAMEERLCRDIHMIQHQLGASARVDMTRFQQLCEEHTLLMREFGRAQERSTTMLNEKNKEIALLQQENIKLRAVQLAKNSELSYLHNDLVQLKARLPEYAERKQLLERVQQLKQRNSELESKLTQLREELADVQKEQSKESNFNKIQQNMLAHSFASEEKHDAKRTIPIVPQLQAKNVLCVGGRSGSIASYRQFIEKVGGNFAHHDGGIEDKYNLLASSLAAADLVICQTGCISHNAYWRVKEFCKRTGKQCVYVENPSISSFARSLETITLETSTIEPIAESPISSND